MKSTFMVKWIMMVSITLTSVTGYCATIHVRVEGNQVYWDDAQLITSNERVSSFWEHMKGLTPTNSWLPGAIFNKPAYFLGVLLDSQA